MKIYRFKIAKNIYKDITIKNNTIIVNSFKLFNEETTEEMLKKHKHIEEKYIQSFKDYLKTEEVHTSSSSRVDNNLFFDNILIDAKHVEGPEGLVGILLYGGKTVLNLDNVHQRDYAHYFVGSTFQGWHALNFINTTPYTMVSKDSYDQLVDFLGVVPSVRLFMPSRYSKFADNSSFMVVYENEGYPTKFTIESEGVEIDEQVCGHAIGERSAKLDALFKQYMPTVQFTEIEKTDQYIKLNAQPVVVDETSKEVGIFKYPMRLEFSSNCGYLPINQFEYNGTDPLEVVVYLDRVPSGTEMILKANTSTFTNLGQFKALV